MGVAPWTNDSSAALPSARARAGRTKGTVSTAPRISLFVTAIAHLSAFGAIMAVTYGLMTLMGRSMQAAAYKQRSNAEQRIEAARLDVLDLGRQVSALMSTDALDRWAVSHGFSRPGLGKESSIGEGEKADRT